MSLTFQIFAAFVLLLVGLRLSAFFSGAETGFYRVSYLRLTIDSHAGDGVARKLMWFVQNPSYFVATTLVGNNVANYITTLAVGLAISAMVTAEGWWVEILGTLMLAPVVFLWGELIPKNLFYRAPMALLRKNARMFGFFYYVFYPVSLPLIVLTKLFERFSRAGTKPLDIVLGRSRLVQVLREGRREGLLTEVQSRLVNGLMHTAGQSVRNTLTPASRVLGVAEDVSREEVLEHARKYGLSHVPVHAAGQPENWFGYVRVTDLRIAGKTVGGALRRMPEIPASASRLEAMLTLRTNGAAFGRAVENGVVVGVANERGLIEQMFRPPQTAGTLRSTT